MAKMYIRLTLDDIQDALADYISETFPGLEMSGDALLTNQSSGELVIDLSADLEVIKSNSGFLSTDDTEIL